MKYKAWVCRDRHLGRKGNGCRMRIVKEEELLKEICRQTGWEEVTEESVKDIDRVEIRAGGVEFTTSQKGKINPDCSRKP